MIREAHLLPPRGEPWKASHRAHGLRLPPWAGWRDDPQERLGTMIAALDFVDVEKAPRYAPGRSTYCNILAHDYAALVGAYLPRVWWYDPQAAAEKAERMGGPIAGAYAAKDSAHGVRELSANGLHEWFLAWGAEFRWERVGGATLLRELVADGITIGVCIARNLDPRRSGHITIARPPVTEQEFAWHEQGKVVQTQAGRFNRRSFADPWWNARELAEPEFYCYAGPAR